MKKLLTLFALMLVCIGQIFAYHFEVDGIYYNKSGSNATVTYATSDYNSYSGIVVIPATVTYGGVTYNVTKIDPYAFYKCSGLTAVTIPNSVESIGDDAFYGCSGLTSVTIPNSVESIGDDAFYGCSGLSSVTIPNSVTSIGVNAFYYCSNLTSVSIGKSVTSIGNSAFSGCSALTNIYIFDIAAWCQISGLNYLTRNGNSNKTLYLNGEVVENMEIPEGPTSIPGGAFYGFQNIKTISIPGSVTSIGNYAFSESKNLTSVNIPNSVTRIGNYAFYGCSRLASIEIPNRMTSIEDQTFRGTGLTSITIPSSVTNIGYYAFEGCRDLTSVYISDVAAWCRILGLSNLTQYAYSPKKLYLDGEEIEDLVIPEGTSSIPDYAFYKFTNIQTATVPNCVTSIGNSAFSGCRSLSVISFSTTKPTIASSPFDSKTSLVVPDEAYTDFVSSWVSYANQITLVSQSEYNVNIKASATEPSLLSAIGEENLRHVLRLKVTGSINGYDIMVLRNKMINLHHLDLSEATIEGNEYEYYTGYHTSDNEIGPYAFYNLPNLYSVVLPEITAIGQYAFGNCTLLHEINLPESLTTLSEYAFSGCLMLPSIDIPGSVATIGSYAFYNCNSLESATFHEGLETIGSYAFCGSVIKELILPESLKEIQNYAFACLFNYEYQWWRINQFEELNLPPNLNTIGRYAFQGCTNLKVVRLNPMLKNISDYAFTGCDALNKVYTYIVEPTDILQDTFSTYKTTDLYVPSPSFYTYFYNTQWSQFLSVNPTDEEYDYKSFYINRDFVMNEESGILGGDPDAELNENSGLVNECSETQELGTVTMRFNGNNGSASIIANGNLTAEKINVEITVTGNKWHFFCFPFDVPLSGVKVSGNKAYVFRHYNAAKRATGASGWEDLPTDQTVLLAGEGYIFQANGNSTLTVTVDNKTTFVGENVATALQVQDASNVVNANWNFKGNPGYAYFDIDELGFSAPITVWNPNTNSYVALRPGDDDAFLHPFQAFFVQKPEGTDALTFNAEDRTTYLASQEEVAEKIKRRRLAAKADSPRKLINLSVTDGTNTDKTRIVFNDEKSMAYEMDCDAAKFAATGVPQLYSLDDANNKYAINERPNGDGTVRLGFTADKSGHFTIEAPRMDTPCYLRDLMKGTTHDFNVGAYEFDSEKGDFNNRFVLVNTLVAEGIEEQLADQKSPFKGDLEGLYDLQGRRQQKAERSLYIINGKKVSVK